MIRLLMVVLLIVLFRNMMFADLVRIKEKDDIIAPYPSTFKLNINLYYLDEDDLLHPVATTIEINQNRYVDAIVEALKEFTEDKALRPLLGNEFTVKNYRNQDRKIYIDVSGNVKNNDIWLDVGPDVLIYGFCNSLLSLDNIDAIIMSIDGVYVNEYTSFDDKYGEIRYNDDYVFEEKEFKTPEDVVKTFLKLVKIRRFDLAYKLTTTSVRREQPPKYFEDMIQNYYGVRKNLSYRIDKNVRFDELRNEYSVFIAYYDEKPSNSNLAGVEDWQVILMDNEYKIIWQEKELKL